MLRLLGDLARGVTGDARELGADHAEPLQISLERRAGPTGSEERVAARQQLPDQLALVIELQPDCVTARSRDLDALIETSLRRDDVPTDEQRVRGLAQDRRTRARVGLHAVELQDDVLDVSLHQRALPRRDIDDERRRPLLVCRPGVVADHAADEDDERADDEHQLRVAAHRGAEGAGPCARVHDLPRATTFSAACMPPR